MRLLLQIAEQTQIQQVTMKEPKKVEAGKRLAEYNRRKREEFAQLKSESKQVEPKLTYYGAGAVVAVGTLGDISCYVNQSKTPNETPVNQPKDHKFEMDEAIEMDKKSMVNDLYQAAVSKMANTATLIKGSLANALAVIGSSYLFSKLSKDSIDTKRKRHDLVIEQLQRTQIEWVYK